MNQGAKFKFQNLAPQTGGLLASSAAPSKKRVFTDAQISELQEAAYSEGQRDGLELALSCIETRVEHSLDHILANYSQLFSSVDGRIDLLRAEAAELALKLAKALVPALIASNPTAEIEALFASCVAHLHAEPRIVIRVEEALIGVLKEKIEAMARKAGYPGRIVLIGEADGNSAACQIEWVDGGVTHRSAAQLAMIDHKIAEFVSCRTSLTGATDVQPDSLTDASTDLQSTFNG